MKKVIFSMAAITGLLAGHPAFATSEWSKFNGFYLGASGGGAFATSHQHVNVNSEFDDTDELDDGVITKTELSSPNNVYENLFKGSVFAGYGSACGCLYLGLEGFVNYENFKESSKVHSETHNIIPDANNNLRTTVNTSTRLDPFQGGVDLRPGVLLNSSTLLYGRIGVAYSEIKLKSLTQFSGDEFPTDSDEAFSGSQRLSKSKSVYAVRAGLGLQQHLSDRWSLRADYIYTYYGKKHVDGEVPLTPEPDHSEDLFSFSSSSRAKLMDNSVQLGIVYTFSC